MKDHVTEIVIFVILFVGVSAMGFVAARWRAVPDEDRTTVRIEPFRTLTKEECSEIEQEGNELAMFLTDGGGGAVEIRR